MRWRRLRPTERRGFVPRVQKTTCCFAVQDKVWVRTPMVLRGRCTPCWPMPRPTGCRATDVLRPMAAANDGVGHGCHAAPIVLLSGIHGL